MWTIKKYGLKTLIFINNLSQFLSLKFVRITGKSKEGLHPKHLIDNPDHYWYLKYIENEDNVLDIGCGQGHHTIKTSESCSQVTGIDINKDYITTAKDLLEKNIIKNVSFRLADSDDEITFSNFDEENFNKIMLLDLLEHLNNPAVTLKQILRILKPNGKLIIAIPNSQTSFKRLKKRHGLSCYADDDHKVEFTKKEIESLLNNSGYRITEEIKPVVFDTPFHGLIDLAGGISLSFYKYLVNKKKKAVQKHPEESTGFRIVAEKITS